MFSLVILILTLLITVCLTIISFKSEFRALVAFLAGLSWFASAYSLFQSGLVLSDMFSIICLMIGFYIWIRVMVK